MRVLLLSLALLFVPSVDAAEPLKVLAYDSAPFFFREGGEPAGLEYEILKYFADAEGRELEVIWESDFPALIPTIESGEADIAAATLTITQERLQHVAFSESYLPVRIMLVERADNVAGDLDALAGSQIATIEGSVYEKLLSRIPGVEVVYAGDQAEMFRWVAEGKTRALATDSPIAFQLMAGYDSLELGLPLTDEQHFGFAVTKGSPLEASLSEHIARLKTSGIYYRLLDRYLGSKAVEIIQTARQD